MTATTARAGDSPAVFVVKGSEPALVDRGVELLLAELTSPEATGAEAQDPTGAREPRCRDRRSSGVQQRRGRDRSGH